MKTPGSETVKVELGVVEIDVETGKYLRGDKKTTTDVTRAIFIPVKRGDLTKQFWEKFHRNRVVEEKINSNYRKKIYKSILIKKTYDRVS